MSFRQTGLCRLFILVLAVCMLTGGVSAALGEPEMTEEQIDEASNKAYEEANPPPVPPAEGGPEEQGGTFM